MSLQELKCGGASPIEMPSLDDFTLLLSHIVKPANHTAWRWFLIYFIISLFIWIRAAAVGVC